MVSFLLNTYVANFAGGSVGRLSLSVSRSVRLPDVVSINRICVTVGRLVGWSAGRYDRSVGFGRSVGRSGVLILEMFSSSLSVLNKSFEYVSGDFSANQATLCAHTQKYQVFHIW